MPKSKYPSQLDTSTELPIVRDNITEIGSDIINSLRSAIINIEKTLGINPQGSTGNTLAERLNRVLDATGNLKNDALTSANVIYGPILDSNVSSVAAIQESKLKLNYPTSLLQDEISILNSTYQILVTQLEELNTLIAIHLSTSSTSSHPASAIYVDAYDSVSSSISTIDILTGSVQDTLNTLYDSHINYSGVNISNTNRSHTAEQIYFNNDEIALLTESNNVQDVIVDLANLKNTEIRSTVLNITSNGKIKHGQITDGYENLELGRQLLDEIDVTYVLSDTSKCIFTLTSPIESNETINEFDVLTLHGSTFDEDNISYQIAKVNMNIDNEIETIVVFGGPKNYVSSGLTATITANTYIDYNFSGFASTVRSRYDKTATPDVQILNPDCATIISDGISPEKITSTNNQFGIYIDDHTVVQIATYNSSLTFQTLDSIIQKINDYSIDNHLNFMAYKVFTNNCYELALSHNIPNFNGDIKQRRIKIAAGTSNSGIANLGLSSRIGEFYYGTTNNSLNLNGLILNQFGIIESFNRSQIRIMTLSLDLQLFDGNFSDYGVRVGDLVCITGSSDSTDDGTYRIKTVLDDVITLDLGTSTFTGALNSDSNVIILRTTATVGEMTFEEISSVNGSIIFDVFMSDDKNILYKKRLEVEDNLVSGTFYAAISDVSKNFIISSETATLAVTTTGYATLTGPSLAAGTAVYVGLSGTYKVYDDTGLSFVTLDVSTTGLPPVNASVTLYGFNEISSNNYHLSRGCFSTGLGRILGLSSAVGIPTLISKYKSGTVDSSIISETFIEKYIEGPRNELRGSGVIRGCVVSNGVYNDSGPETYQEFDVSAGVYIVNGIRHEFPGVTAFRVYAVEHIVVGFNKFGCLAGAEYIDNPLSPGNNISPYFQDEFTYLAELSNDHNDITNIHDLRLFVDHLDYKVLRKIIVSKDLKFGHFDNVSDAVLYSKKIKKLFINIVEPSIEVDNGTFEIDDTININFDLKISGSGPGTILTKTTSFASGTALTGALVDMGTSIFMIGNSSNTSDDDIAYGITLSNFTYVTSTDLDHVGAVISICQPIEKDSVVIARRATYVFNNINFDGPATIDGSVADPNKIGEYAFVIGQQNPNTLSAIGNITLGNIIISGCRFNRMGLENGAIKFLESASAVYQDIIVSQSIITRGSPNLVNTTPIAIEYPTTSTVQNIIEVGSISRTGT